MSNPFQQPDNSSLSNTFQGLQISDLRRIRDKYIVEIQKKKRERYFGCRKRFTTPENLLNNQFQEEDEFGQGVLFEDFIADCQKRTFTLEQLSELILYLNLPGRYGQHFAVIGIRKLLCDENNASIQRIIDHGVIPKLVEFLGKEDEIQLQREAAWALSNVAARTTEQTKEVVDNGAIPELIKLLESPHKEVQAEAVWALKNITADDNTNYRDMILHGGAIDPLIKITEEALAIGNMEMVKQGNQTLSCLCRGKPTAKYEEIKDALPIFVKVLKSSIKVQEVLSDALWPLTHFCEGEERIQWFIDIGVVPSLLKLMDLPFISVRVPCIRILGYIFTGAIDQVEYLLSVPGIVDKLFEAFKHSEMHVRKETAWALSNITAGKHKDLILGNADYLDFLFGIGINDKAIEVRRKVAQIFNNGMNDLTPEELRFLLEKEIFEYFEKLIEEKEYVLQEAGLRGIRSVLGHEGFPKDFYWTLLEKKKTREVIERRQNHALRVSKLSSEILGFMDSASEERYFDQFSQKLNSL